MPNLKLAYTET